MFGAPSASSRGNDWQAGAGALATWPVIAGPAPVCVWPQRRRSEYCHTSTIVHKACRKPRFKICAEKKCTARLGWAHGIPFWVAMKRRPPAVGLLPGRNCRAAKANLGSDSPAIKNIVSSTVNDIGAGKERVPCNHLPATNCGISKLTPSCRKYILLMGNEGENHAEPSV